MTVQKQMAKERERLHAQLNQAQKMEAIGTLAGGIAHDFNNILMSVTGFTQVAMNEPDEEERRENLVRVLKSSERARDLVKQILVFSRQVEQERKPLDLVVMVKEALKLLRAVLPSTIEFQKKITSEQVMILGDPTQIHQILMNLSTNAAHSMQEGGVLEVCLEKTEVFPDAPLPSPDLKPGPYAKLVVKDTGKGISPAIMDQIFNPFFTTKSVGEGTGLGLSVVYGIVKSYNGAITVQSELGKGATFNVYLPLTETAMPKDDKSVSSPIPKGSEHLLLVDDEEPVIKPVKKMLESLGYDVTCCMSSVEALDLFLKEPNRFDLVITDMTMPKMTGVKLARKMMDVRPDIPIILCTGYSGMITVEQAKMLGLRAFIMKPILKEELAVVIRDVLDGGE
jgi:nitrogen-specific signal transduction histidine kinase